MLAVACIRFERPTMKLFAAAATLLCLLTTSAFAEQTTLRMGFQKNGVFVTLKQQHLLEDAFKTDGVVVQWVEFQSGPPMMEALNAGAIDVGSTGDTPPVFAQAAGVDLLYIASQPVRGVNAGIVVPKDSPIRSVADLKGHSIAFTKGSSSHYQTLQTLATAGLKLSDVKPIYLNPSDAAAAFRAGRLEAWTIWDPFYAIVERDPNARVLTNGTVAPTNGFFLATRVFAEAHPAVIVKLVSQINAAAIWSGTHQEELAQTMTALTGVDLETQRIAAARGAYTAAFLTPEVIARQQQVADTFFALKIIPRHIDIAGAVFHPPGQQAVNEAKQP